MHRRVHAELRALTQVDADAHLLAIQTELTGKPRDFTDLAPVSRNESGIGWVARCQERFRNQADADSFFSALVGRLSLAAARAGSEITWHDCTHDERVPQPCVIGGRQVK